MDCSLMVILVGFNCWNWFLCCTGFTTIEFFKRQALEDDDNLYDFSFENVKDNLFVIFGTIKPLRILSPSLRALPFSGIEWSFKMRDLGYNEEGYKWSPDSETPATKPQSIEMQTYSE